MGLFNAPDKLKEAYFELADSPGDRLSWERLGDIYLERLVINKASHCYQKSFEVYQEQAPDSSTDSPIFNKFKESYERRRNDPAHNSYMDAMRDISNGADTASLYAKTQRLLSLYPDSSQVHGVHGIVCLIRTEQIGDTRYADEGIRSSNKAITIDSTEPTYYLDQAILYLMKNDLRKSASLLEDARVLIDANRPLGIASRPTKDLEEDYLAIQNDLNSR